VDFGKSLYGVRIEDVTLCAGGRGIQNGDIVRLERNGKKIGLVPFPVPNIRELSGASLRSTKLPDFGAGAKNETSVVRF